MDTTRVSTDLDGRTLSIETGWMAEQANGAVWVRQGDTVLLVTATASRTPREGIDFFPLTCDYEEKLYAAGRIPGAFMRREGRPSEQATLAARMIDRPMRPLFPKDFRNDVQIVATVLSTDQVNDPTVLAVIGAGAAMAISDIPHAGPVAATRVGCFDGVIRLDPGMPDMERSELDLMVAGTRGAINMVEAGAREVSEATVVEALQRAQERLAVIVGIIDELVAKAGRPKSSYPRVATPPEVKAAVEDQVHGRLDQAFREADKARREEQIDQLRAAAVAELEGRFPGREKDLAAAFESVLKAAVRRAILDEGQRPDGRRSDEIRPIWCRVGVLPRTHGSAIFTRGQTQALSVVTLGTMSDQQKIDGLGLETFKRYLHHYNFPPFSVGEARPLRSPGRREIGHGALAERAVRVMVPPVEDFPYVVRIVTEILSSNGSTSMASVCGSTLALMDAGVPLRAPVGGIAMGLVTDEQDPTRYAILSDIQGMEDNLGDMDFKVAGTRQGITALQMDIKVQGLTPEIFRRALEQARVGRLHILDKMAEALAEPRQAMSTFAPRIITIEINPDKIRDIIGPGGKTIRRIQEETGASIDIEDDGRVFLATVDPEAMERAVAMIRDLTESVEVGRIYKGKVVRIMPFGAFVEILPKQDGLVHISQLAEQRVGKVEDVVSIGDEIMVKVTEIDDRGRVNLSRKQAIQELARPSAGNGATG